MIAYVKGTLEEVTENDAVVEANGIGYYVKISPNTMSRLPSLHREVKLYTYTYVREDTFCLYGFLTKDELHVFRMLLTVNGVGPKGALGILSVMGVQDVRCAILAADSRMIAKAPGIGRKTAERVILDLRDKVSADDILQSGMQEAAALGMQESGARNEAVEALVALGYGASEALKAINQLPDTDGMDTEAILKAALKHMI